MAVTKKRKHYTERLLYISLWCNTTNRMLGIGIKKDYIVIDHEVAVMAVKSGKTAVFKKQEEADAIRDHLRKEVQNKDKVLIRTIQFIH